jgi:type 1 fimbria pilin
MTDQLESDLRTALRERAAQVPEPSIDRLTRFDYRPRTRGLAPPLRIGIPAGAAGAAGVVAVVLSLGGGVSSAFAGWSPTPTAPSAGQLAQAQANCGHSAANGLALQLTDTRGPFTFSIYADSTSSSSCITGPSFTAVSTSTSSSPITVPAGTVQLTLSHANDPNGQAYSFAEGHAGSGVSGVALVLDNGTNVQATLENGWFVAWWPGTNGVTTADLTTPAGVKAEPLHETGAPTAGSGQGSNSVSSGGRASGGPGGPGVQSSGSSSLSSGGSGGGLSGGGPSGGGLGGGGLGGHHVAGGSPSGAPSRPESFSTSSK